MFFKVKSTSKGKTMNTNQKGGNKAPPEQGNWQDRAVLHAAGAPRNRQGGSAGSDSPDAAGSERRPFGFLRLRQRHARRDA
jgi:hypothetical protein